MMIDRLRQIIGMPDNAPTSLSIGQVVIPSREFGEASPIFSKDASRIGATSSTERGADLGVTSIETPATVAQKRDPEPSLPAEATRTGAQEFSESLSDLKWALKGLRINLAVFLDEPEKADLLRDAITTQQQVVDDVSDLRPATLQETAKFMMNFVDAGGQFSSFHARTKFNPSLWTSDRSVKIPRGTGNSLMDILVLDGNEVERVPVFKVDRDRRSSPANIVDHAGLAETLPGPGESTMVRSTHDQGVNYDTSSGRILDASGRTGTIASYHAKNVGLEQCVAEEMRKMGWVPQKEHFSISAHRQMAERSIDLGWDPMTVAAAPRPAASVVVALPAPQSFARLLGSGL